MIPSTIFTDRCLLRSPADADAPFVFSASRHPGFTDGMLWDPPKDEGEILGFHKTIEIQRREESAFTFTIEHRSSAAFLGRIVIRMTETPGVWSIGFWLHPDHWGKGFMTEAVRAVLAFGFAELGASRITARHATWNDASKRVMLRAGFCHVGNIEQGFLKHGVWIPEEEYALALEDWQGSA